MLRTKACFNSHGLGMAMHKKELLLFTGRHIPLLVHMISRNEVIRTKISEDTWEKGWIPD